MGSNSSLIPSRALVLHQCGQPLVICGQNALEQDYPQLGLVLISRNAVLYIEPAQPLNDGLNLPLHSL